MAKSIRTVDSVVEVAEDGARAAGFPSRPMASELHDSPYEMKRFRVSDRGTNNKKLEKGARRKLHILGLTPVKASATTDAGLRQADRSRTRGQERADRISDDLCGKLMGCAVEPDELFSKAGCQSGQSSGRLQPQSAISALVSADAHALPSWGSCGAQGEDSNKENIRAWLMIVEAEEIAVGNKLQDIVRGAGPNLRHRHHGGIAVATIVFSTNGTTGVKATVGNFARGAMDGG
ncbi:uncharacterized protein IWZ02DRAFT_429731 [Phyllosticta citriasiana]|uniref:uncharacterized protein n=1 Tax=Phyllosticta citriasiana TaxID=595635 RepID=UPI0030FDAA5D